MKFCLSVSGTVCSCMIAANICFAVVEDDQAQLDALEAQLETELEVDLTALCFVHEPKSCSEILDETTTTCGQYECYWIVDDFPGGLGGVYSCEGASASAPTYAKLIRPTFIQKLKTVSSGGQTDYVDGQSFYCSETTRCSCSDYGEFSEGGVCHETQNPAFPPSDGDLQTDKVLVGGACPVTGGDGPAIVIGVGEVDRTVEVTEGG